MKGIAIRYRTLLVISILAMSTSPTVSGQKSVIRGNIKYESSNIILDSLNVFLMDTTGTKLETVITDGVGDYKFENLEKGTYDVETDATVPRPQRITGIYLNDKEVKIIDLVLKDPCEQDKSKGRCPVCRSKRKVIPTSPGSILSYNFGRDSIMAKKAWEKVEKRGYETRTNENGEEELINIFIDSEKEKFWDTCNRWFCKRCKKIF